MYYFNLLFVRGIWICCIKKKESNEILIELIFLLKLYGLCFFFILGYCGYKDCKDIFKFKVIVVK